MTRTESFKRINPAGKVPVMQTADGFYLSERYVPYDTLYLSISIGVP